MFKNTDSVSVLLKDIEYVISDGNVIADTDQLSFILSQNDDVERIELILKSVDNEYHEELLDKLFDCAISQSSLATVQYLVDNYNPAISKVNMITACSRTGDCIELISYLLAKSTDIDLNYACFIALIHNNIEIGKYLIHIGADLNFRTDINSRRYGEAALLTNLIFFSENDSSLVIIDFLMSLGYRLPPEMITECGNESVIELAMKYEKKIDY
jgi:ankyrin repeat protein